MNIDQQRGIEAVLLRYATAADTRDKALLANCFTPDVKADYGDQIGRFESRDALVAHLSNMLSACGPTLHYISNIVLAQTASGVKSRCYTQAVVTLPGVEVPIRTAGFYEDDLIETSEGWKICMRVYRGIA